MIGETLVMVSPMLCDARVFGPQIADLSTEMPVMFAPTTQGERIEEIANQIMGWAPKRFALCGMGMGGAVALEIVRRVPERVTRLALISTSFTGETPEGASRREPLIIAARTRRFDEVIEAELKPDWLSPGPARAGVLTLVRHMAHANGVEAYVRQARAMQRRREQQAVLARINQPTLVMCGQDDIHLPVKRHQFMAEFIPSAGLEVIAGAGHLPTLEQPDEVTDHLRDWLRAPFVLRPAAVNRQI